MERVRQLCASAGLDEPLAFDWLLVRTIEYLFWALGAGLATEPEIRPSHEGQFSRGVDTTSPAPDP